MPKLLELTQIRGGEEGCPVELWRDDDTGRLVIRGYNEAGFSAVDIDLVDLFAWISGAEGQRIVGQLSA